MSVPKLVKSWSRQQYEEYLKTTTVAESHPGLIKEGTEDADQAAVIAWAQEREGSIPALSLLHAIPNDGTFSAKAGQRRKLMGRKAGVPDLHLPVARGKFIGLWIEMKRTPYRDKKGKLCRGTVSKEQRAWIDRLRAAGHRVEVCEGADLAIEILKDYLSLENAAASGGSSRD